MEKESMGWFKRLKDGIQTATKFKKETPDGLWHKCKDCGETNTYKDLKENFFKCPNCNYHERIGSYDYFDILFDGKYQEMFEDLLSSSSCFLLSSSPDTFYLLS